MNKMSIFSAALWKIIEKFGTKGIQFVIQIILARILVPDDYGIVAILTVFISLSNVFIQNGFSTSLIQKKEATQADFCTAFFCSIGIAALFYLLLFVLAPLIANFYDMYTLKNYLRVLSLVLFAGSFNSIQYAYVSRTLNFRVYTISTLIASIVSGIMGVVFAMREFGVWALIFQQLIANYLSVFILYVLVQWRVQLLFSRQSLMELFGYGWKILGSSLINSLYASIYNLVIGRVYTKEILGLYSRGQQFPLLITDNINEIVQSITLPILSQSQDNQENMKNLMYRSLTISTFIVFPAMVGLSAISYEFIHVVLGEKWLVAAPYMALLCIVYSVYPIHTMNIQCMKAMGRSDWFLKLEILKKLLEALSIAITMKMGLVPMIVGQIILSFVGIPINIWATNRLIHYGISEQLKDILPSILASVLMFGAVKMVSLIAMPVLFKMVTEILVGVGVYATLSVFMKNSAFFYLLNKYRVQKIEKEIQR